MTTINRCLTYYRTQHVEHDVIDKARVDYCIAALSPYFGRRQAEKLTTRHTREYTQKRRNKKISQGTICREIACLMAALHYCEHEGVIDKAPALKRPRRPPARDRWLTKDEACRLIKAAGERARLFIRIALGTGGRPESIDALKWSQIDFDAKLIYFNDRGREQTNKRRPVVPMSDVLYVWLRQVHQTSRSPYVLGSSASTYKAVRGAILRAGLNGVTRKTLRHTWATWAAQRGVTMWEIAGILGTSMATAERNYAHHAPEYLRGAVNYDQ